MELIFVTGSPSPLETSPNTSENAYLGCFSEVHPLLSFTLWPPEHSPRPPVPGGLCLSLTEWPLGCCLSCQRPREHSGTEESQEKQREALRLSKAGAPLPRQLASPRRREPEPQGSGFFWDFLCTYSLLSTASPLVTLTSIVYKLKNSLPATH